jgi:hypothetical protein
MHLSKEIKKSKVEGKSFLFFSFLQNPAEEKENPAEEKALRLRT